MKRLGLLALVLALGAVLLVVWSLSRTPAPEPARTAEAEPVPQEPEKKEETGLAALEPASADVDPMAREELPAPEAKGKGLEAWDVERSRWVEGFVRAPAGCSEEDALEVFATSEGVDHNRLARLATSPDKPAVLLARRPVAKDGTFRVPFPPDAKVGNVTVLGRYLYLPESIAVDLAQGKGSVELEPRCGAWITGLVTLPADSTLELRELDELAVKLGTSIERFRGSMVTMQQLRRETKLAGGAFEFRGVPTEIRSTLEIAPAALAAASQPVEDLRAGRENPVSVALLAGGAISGVVRDAQGSPVAGAEVSAARKGQWFGFDNREIRKTRSRDDGTFDLAAVSPGAVVLTADLDGYLESDRQTVELVDRGSRTGVELVLTRGKSISGRIAWPDGKPAAGVDVKVEFDMSAMVGMTAFNALRGRDGETKTDGEGAFAVGGLGEGPFSVKASAPPPEGSPEGGDAAKAKKTAWWRARIDGVAPGTSGFELVLRKPEGIAGRVQDETGAPVAKFKLEARREGKGLLGNLGNEEATDSFEDAEGRFLLAGLAEGTWKVYATAEGFGLPEPSVLDVPRAADAPEILITIVHAASVSGTVKNPGGGTVAGAKVTVGGEGPSWQRALQGGPKPPVATSRADGTFLLEGLSGGPTSLVGSSEELAKSLPVEVALEAGKRLDGVVIVLREGGLLTGEVFGEGGRPASGLLVQATQLKDFETEMTFSDAEGRFRIEHLLPGTWQVVAMPAGSGGGDAQPGAGGDSKEPTDGMMDMISKMKTAVVTIAEAESTHVVLGAPPKDPVEVHGTVTHAGEPLAGAMLAFMAEGKGGGLQAMKTATVKEDGAYAVKLDAPGHYSISVQRILGGMGQQSTVEFAETIPETKDHRLDLAMPTARISGRVRDPNGDPAAGVRISLNPESPVAIGTMWGGQYHEGVTDADGRYDVRMLRPGTYLLGAGGSTLGGLFGGEEAFGREVRSGLKLAEGEWMKDVDFRLKKSGALEVRVVDASGSSVGSAAVFVREADGRLVDGFSMVTTKADGKARYPGLGPGTYTVSARKELLASLDSARVKVEEGGSASVEVVLQPGTMLLVTTVGAESAPERASVSVQDEDGREVGAMISLAEVMDLLGSGGLSSTEHRIGPLPQGKYKVRATSSDGRTVSKPVSLTGQAERKMTIRFD